jgi:hypothetical protein
MEFDYAQKSYNVFNVFNLINKNLPNPRELSL